ncbi:MAG: relaxase/mobilization nuclease domain-containing protein [Candidatus Binataceae bacterium]
MRRSRLFNGRSEGGLRLRPLKPGRELAPKLVPWWVGAMRRASAANAIRRQAKTSLEGGGAAPRRGRSGPRFYGRRSVVKASFRRNRCRGGWVRHARYLARERAQLEVGRGLGFDAGRDDLDIPAVVREWERNDELMWSVIVSPEDARDLDLKQHVRDLVAEMETDLGTRLEWVAIDHHNTDDEHVHLLIRGVREDGRVLMLDRDYLSRGIRELSQELVERKLGLRTEHEMLQARGLTIEREQWTEIDRALQRRAGLERVVSYQNFEGQSETARIKAEQEIARLGFLENLGLARRVGDQSWKLATNHESELRRRQQDHDIIKTRARERQHQRDIDRGDDLER